MVTPSYCPIKGGAETVVRNLAIKLNQMGIRTDVMTFNMDRKWNPHWQTRMEKIDGINIYRIAALNWYPLEHSDKITLGINLIPGRFRNYLCEYDVVHFHVGDLSFPFFSLTVGKSKIAHFHGPLGFYKRYFLSKLILKKMAGTYIAISRNMYKELTDLGVKTNRIKYLPNAVDTNVFRPSGKKDDNLVLFIGRITFDKGVHVLLESLRYLKTKIHLVIIGTPAWDIEYFHEIQNQIARENRKNFHRIDYLGAQEQDCIVKWCQQASVFVLPSFKEAFPITILEALSCGTAVVATNVGGINEAVANGKDGIVVSTNNSLQLASAIQYLLDNENVRTSFGQEGRRLVTEHFSYDEAIKQLCRIYEELS